MPAADSPNPFVLAACLALAAVPTAAAEPGSAWMVNRGDTNAELVYGSTETPEAYSFAMSCNNSKKQSDLTVYKDIAGAKVGDPLTIEISVGSAKVTVKGKTSTDEMSGYVFGVAKRNSPSSRGSLCSRAQASQS
jgi:hypothetical protein